MLSHFDTLRGYLPGTNSNRTLRQQLAKQKGGETVVVFGAIISSAAFLIFCEAGLILHDQMYAIIGIPSGLLAVKWWISFLGGE